ncbi:putative pectin lyase E [Xylariaceae sp. FL0255]|nr:putative pectin lyase E [Xylariaceae sp. FL0255]
MKARTISASSLSATTVYPTTVAEVKSYLTSTEPQNICHLWNLWLDFVGSEGTTTYRAGNTYACTPSAGGQAMLNTLDRCGSASLYDVTIDTAGYEGINVQSDKTLVGKNGATLYGKGFLRMVGISNIIIQNIEITNLKPAYVWGVDAIVLSDTSDIWIEPCHCKTSLLGRQHYSFGQDADNAVTISNSFINGVTTDSATCYGHTYWGLELVGSSDTITFYQNYVYYTSGRSPALSGNTQFHAVNDVWADNSGHLIEGTADGMGAYEGNVFDNCPTIVASGFRNCVANEYLSSDSFNYDRDGFFVDFGSYTIVGAASASSIASSVPAKAGNTL